jgi:hypothetical protein
MEKLHLNGTSLKPKGKGKEISDSLISKHFLPISLPKFQAPRDDGVQPLARSISSKQKSKRSKPLPNDA